MTARVVEMAHAAGVSVEGELGIFTANWDGFEDGTVRFSCDERRFAEECLEEVVQTVSLTGNVVLSTPMENRVRAYVAAGGGFMATDFNLEDADGTSGFGMLYKAGIDFALANDIRLGGQYTYLDSPDTELPEPNSNVPFARFSTAGSAVSLTVTVGF